MPLEIGGDAQAALEQRGQRLVRELLLASSTWSVVTAKPRAACSLASAVAVPLPKSPSTNFAASPVKNPWRSASS